MGLFKIQFSGEGGAVVTEIWDDWEAVEVRCSELVDQMVLRDVSREGVDGLTEAEFRADVERRDIGQNWFTIQYGENYLDVTPCKINEKEIII